VPATGDQTKMMASFVGSVELMKQYFTPEQQQVAVNEFIKVNFGKGAQMIDADDPTSDFKTKMVAIDYLLDQTGMKTMRKQVLQMAKDYESAFNAKKAPEPLAEAEVKAQLRKGMPHLRDLKAPDFLDLLDEINDGNGRFRLQNIPLNVKVDGFGGRFGKNADGKPFMGTSRTEPRYQAGFLAYHKQKGTTDPDVLGRAQLFDQLFNEMMNAVQLVDSKLGPDFLVNKQVTCEVLYLPFATETPEGKLKFVGISYDKLPEGVQLALVPFRVTDADTGEDLEDSNKFIKQLLSVGSSGSVMFIDNSLTQKEGLDVTEIINPLDNIEELKQIVSDTSGKRDRVSQQLKREVEEKLQPIKLSLEKAIIEDPNIIGKDILGKDYEGIVINSRLGPIKVTSQEQRDVISAKNAAMANARSERPRGESKTAVVAIGSFVGHRGHQDLFKYTIDKAKELGGDPYLFIGNAEGKDDPIPPAVKVQTWHKLYPEYANNISTVQAGGSLIQKVKHELINPLPGKPPRYDNVVIMVGEDRAGLTMPAALMKAVNKFSGYEHVKVSLGITPRESGFSGTALRNSLKNDAPEQALAVWSKAFDIEKLGKDWILHLMDITKKGMGIAQQPAAPVPQPVAERLSTALIRPRNTVESAGVGIITKQNSTIDVNKKTPMKNLKAFNLAELSNDKLGQYKKAAGAQASAADKAGDTKKADKRFSGIVKATKKQFANDEKGVTEFAMSGGDDEEDPFDNYPCYDCGSTIFLHHTKLCELAEPNAKHDLPAKPGSQHWTGEIPKGLNPIPGLEEGVAEGAPIVVALPPIDVRNPKKAPQPYRNQGDIVPDTKPPSTEKRGVKGRPGQRPMPDHSVAETSISTQVSLPKWQIGLTVFVKHLGQKGEIASLGNDSAIVDVGMRQYRVPLDGLKRYPSQGMSEKMLPKSAFAGSNKNKLGPAAHLKGTGNYAKAGDLVGEAGKKKDADGKDKCVPVSEDVENIMDVLINKIIFNEAIQNNKR
jgi:hypothetical protein